MEIETCWVNGRNPYGGVWEAETLMFSIALDSQKSI